MSRTEPLSLLDLFERSGDSNIGQTLIRLAGLAEAAHRAVAAGRTIDSAGKDLDRANGLAPQPLPQPRTDAGGAVPRVQAAYTEVGR